MDNCVFCSKELRIRYLEEEKVSFVMLSNPRLAVGHLLIIPKRHVHVFSDLKNQEILEMGKMIAKYQDKVLKTLGQGTEIRQNYRPEKPDSKTHVNHFHFHILPRNLNDELAKKVDVARTPLYTDMSKGEEAKVKKLLK